MYRLATGGAMDVEEVRDRVRRMTDEQLLSYGKAAAYMCTPKANLGRPPREAYLIQLSARRMAPKTRRAFASGFADLTKSA